MTRIATTLLLSAALILPAARYSHADTVDMSALTCSDLLGLDSDDAGTVIFWLHGYYGGLAKDTKIDVKSIERGAKVLGEYCAKNKKTTVMNAIKKLSS